MPKTVKANVCRLNMERMRILHYTCFAHPPQEGDIGDGGHIGGKASRLQGRAAGAFSLLVCRSLCYNKNKCYKEEPNMPVSRENVLYFDPNSEGNRPLF